MFFFFIYKDFVKFWNRTTFAFSITSSYLHTFSPSFVIFFAFVIAQLGSCSWSYLWISTINNAMDRATCNRKNQNRKIAKSVIWTVFKQLLYLNEVSNWNNRLTWYWYIFIRILHENARYQTEHEQNRDQTSHIRHSKILKENNKLSKLVYENYKEFYESTSTWNKTIPF